MNLTFSDDPQRRPISQARLSVMMKDTPELYKSIAKYCVLSVAGTSDSLRDISHVLLTSILEGPVDLFVSEDRHRRDVYMDCETGIWTYVVSYLDFYKAFLDGEGNLGFAEVN